MKAASVSTERSSIAKAAQAKDKPAKAYEVRADKPQGLLLRVQPSGVRTFYVQLGRGWRVRIGQAGTYTLQQAAEAAKKIILDPQCAAKRSSDALTLGGYITQNYTDHALAKLKNGQKSIDRVKSVWKPFLTKRLTDITATEIDKFRDKRILSGVAPATVNRDVSALSGVFSHWCKNNKGQTHPLADLEALSVADDETVRYLTPDCCRRPKTEPLIEGMPTQN